VADLWKRSKNLKLILLLSSLLMFSAALFAQQQDAPSTSKPAAAQSQSPAAGSPASAATDSAILHVYRARRYAGSALAPSIYVDDKQIARVGNGRHVCIRLSPSSHQIRSDDKSSAISLDAKAGQEYYIRIDEETGFWKGHGRLTLVLPEQGSAEYKLQKPIEEDRKVNKELILDDSDCTASPPKN
jgi:Protein of unknown function (DUF2846)